MAPASVHETLSSPGSPLDPSTLEYMGRAFGHDFSRVRVHHDSQAGRSAREAGAFAYAVGRDIVFGEGRYAPSTREGQELLAHELAHVVQQEGAAPALLTSPIEVGEPDDLHEREAERAAEAVMRGTPVAPLVRGSGAPILRGAWAQCGEPETCPPREPGERERAARASLDVAVVGAPLNGLLVSGFAISGSDASSLASNPTWSAFASQVSSEPHQYEVLGFTDCHGGEEHNSGLRMARARAVHAALPPVGQARVTPSAAPLSDCMDANASEAGRARNRAAFFHQTATHWDMPPQQIVGIGCPPRRPDPVTTMQDYVTLLRCAERIMGLPPREMLAMFRQIYYGPDWAASPDSYWENVIPGSPAVGDPRARLGRNLFRALRRSAVVVAEAPTPFIVDVGHMFTGLEAMVSPRPSVRLSGIAVNLPNEEFATWGGDLGAAVAASVACPAMNTIGALRDPRCGRLMGAHPLQDYLDIHAGGPDLEGDIDAFAIRAASMGIPCATSSMRPFSLSRPVSDVFAGYYLDPSASTSRGRVNPYRCMLLAMGATLSGSVVTNLPALEARFGPRVADFAKAFFIGMMWRPSGPGERSSMETNGVEAVRWYVRWLVARL